MKSIFFLIAVLCVLRLNAQTQFEILPPDDGAIHTSGMNQVDSLGNRTGYWCINDGHRRFYYYYQNGKLNGMCRYYTNTKNGWRLNSIGLFKDDIYVGQWQFFYDNGSVSWIALDITENTMFIEEASKFFYQPKETKQCYNLIYSQDGRITEEGWSIFGENLESEYEKVGDWKIYAPDGTVTIKHYGSE